MPAKWQKWMPLKIDAFFGSPGVQAMNATAQMGYLRLLTTQWQSEDGTISSDPLDLAENSGLGDDGWAIHAARIMRKFDPVDGTQRIRNLVNYNEWKEAKRIFEARQEAAKNTTKTRSPRKSSTVTVDNSNGHRSHTVTVTDGTPSRSADTMTQTVTGTETNTSKKQKPLSKKSGVDTRRKDFIDDLKRHWEGVNPNTEFRFDDKDGKQVGLFLAKWPALKREEWRECLRHRRESESVIFTQEIFRWIGNLMDFRDYPLDRFGKPRNGGNHAAVSSGKTDRNVGLCAELIAEDQYRSGSGENGVVQAGNAKQNGSATLFVDSGAAGYEGFSSGDGNAGGGSERARGNGVPPTW